MTRPIISIPIDDKELEAQYKNLNSYGRLKRILIEIKYNRAVEKQIKKDYDRISKKDN